MHNDKQYYKPLTAQELGITSDGRWGGSPAICSLLWLCLLLWPACAASDAEVRKAQASGYKTDFATVYGEALAAVVHRYPHTVENAVTGLIQTAWHPVAGQSGSGSDSNPRNSQVAGGQPTGGGIQSITNTVASDRKRFYIRFRVHVVGGKPWRVRVVGEASEVRAGDVPMPLKGAEIPHWVKGRTDALRVAIHQRLKAHAVRVAREIPMAEGPIIQVREPSSFGDIPELARTHVAAVHRALRTRDMSELRTLLADDLVWSDGDAGSAEVALALWQADTRLLDSLSKILEAGCARGDGDLTVSCPLAYSQEANYHGRRAIFEEREGRWLMTAYTGGD